MKPVLFSENATDFSTNGVGRLDPISCIVTEERNGKFELEMTVLLSDRHFSGIKHSAIVAVKPSPKRGIQAFRIYKVSKPINGKVKVYARHISYQLSYIPFLPFSAQGAQRALDGFKNNAAENCPFTFWTNIQSASSFVVSLPGIIRTYLGGTKGSILDIYGGEYEWDNYTVKLHASRGADNGVTLRYGKNITDLQQEENIENTYTGICPYWASTEGELVTLPEKVVHSANAANFPFKMTVVQDFSGAFDNKPSAADLRKAAQAYIAENNIGVPKVSIDVSFIDLAQTEEYKGILSMQDVELCDTVTVEFAKLRVSAKAKVRQTVYDVLSERYTKIQIGDESSTLAKTIEDQITAVSVRPTAEEMQANIDRATGVLNSGLRGHVILNRNSDGYVNEILILDDDNIEQAENVLRMNMNGIGFSSTGYSGSYYQSWTLDGHLSLGGVNNAYGALEILDPGGNIIGAWNKDGIVVNEGDIDLKRGSDFGLYINGSVFRFGDFEVNDLYGRQVLQSSDEMTGMSGEPENSSGLYLWAGWESNNKYVFVVNGMDAYVKRNGTGKEWAIADTLANFESRISALEGDE